MQDNWTPSQRKLIEWLATPRFERAPPHQEMLAERLGVNPATLWRWRNKPGFQEAVNRYARQMLVNDLPDIYGAIVREAIKGSYQHAKLALELAGEVDAGSSDTRLRLVIEYADPETDATKAPSLAGSGGTGGEPL